MGNKHTLTYRLEVKDFKWDFSMILCAALGFKVLILFSLNLVIYRNRKFEIKAFLTVLNLSILIRFIFTRKSFTQIEALFSSTFIISRIYR